MANQFEPGDKVELKSGGPVMTVVEVHSNDSVSCQWFNSQGSQYEINIFKPGVLNAYETKS